MFKVRFSGVSREPLESKTAIWGFDLRESLDIYRLGDSMVQASRFE